MHRSKADSEVETNGKEKDRVALPGQLLSDQFLSDEINDIISHKSNWVVRYGISMVGGISLLLVILSWYLRYPDILKASMTITAVNAPKIIAARTEGMLQSLLVENGDSVKVNQPLAYLKSTGSHKEILALHRWLTNIVTTVSHDNIEKLDSLTLQPFTSLGELQQPYFEFHTAYMEFLRTLPQGFYGQKLEALKEDIKLVEERGRNLSRQKRLILDNLEVQEKEYKAKESLVSRPQAISLQELSQDKNKPITKLAIVQQMKVQKQLQKANLHNRKMEMMKVKKEIEDLRSIFFTSLLMLKNKTKDWVDRYIVLSPENGELQFAQTLQENQDITDGQELFYVVPENSQFYGKIIADQTGFGKIAIGQSVIVKVESYPSSEFGYLRGRVIYISPQLVNGRNFMVQIELPGDMITTYNRVIPYKNNMKATTEILTENRRLLEKLFLDF